MWVYEEKADATKGQLSGPKLGVIVSKKTDTRATKRNLWKRRIKEAFRRLQSTVKPGAAVLIQTKSRDGVASYEEIKTEIEKLLFKAKVQK